MLGIFFFFENLATNLCVCRCCLCCAKHVTKQKPPSKCSIFVHAMWLLNAFFWVQHLAWPTGDYKKQQHPSNAHHAPSAHHALSAHGERWFYQGICHFLSSLQGTPRSSVPFPYLVFGIAFFRPELILQVWSVSQYKQQLMNEIQGV